MSLQGVLESPSIDDMARRVSTWRVGINLFGELTTDGTSWIEARAVASQAPDSTKPLRIELTNPADKIGGGGAESVTIEGWRVSDGYPVSQLVELTDTVVLVSDLHGAFSMKATGTAVGTITAGHNDPLTTGQCRIEAGARRSSRSNLWLPAERRLMLLEPERYGSSVEGALIDRQVRLRVVPATDPTWYAWPGQRLVIPANSWVVLEAFSDAAGLTQRAWALALAVRSTDFSDNNSSWWEGSP